MKGKKLSRKVQWIPVVAGLMRKGQHVLLGQRPQEDHLAGHWEFPGGKIEPGEAPEEALKREFQEELGIECEPGELKFAVTHAYDKVQILILFYEILYWKGEPRAQHHMHLEWVPVQEVKTRKIPEANRKILPILEKILSEP